MTAAVTRRDLLRTAGRTAGVMALVGCKAEGQPVAPAQATARAGGPPKAYSLPPLPYAYNSLEPYLDERTVRLHHDKHHAGYVKGLNAALAKLAAVEAVGDVSMAKYWTADVAFNGAGDVLHTLYWENMIGSGRGGGVPDGPIVARLDAEFGSVGTFAKTFAAVAASVPGSGWAVLAYEPLGDRLVVTGVQKHENVDIPGSVPLLVCDVWEHAYYLQYQNRRKEYIEAFMKHLVNWDAVNRRLTAELASNAVRGGGKVGQE